MVGCVFLDMQLDSYQGLSVCVLSCSPRGLSVTGFGK